METVSDFIFSGSKITEDGDYSHEIKIHFLLGSKAMTNLDGVLKKKKKQKHHSADKDSYHQSYIFSSNHVQMWGLDHKEGWARVDALELWY